jgi:DNA (cytosine-5)-methyltransferase 1
VGLIVDLFAGPGGWSEGLAALGLAGVELELDATVCATRRTAGHRSVRCDVARFPAGHLAGRVEGLIASPPCPLFSLAGRGAGRAVLVELARAALDVLAGRPALASHRRVMARKLRARRLASTSHTRHRAAEWAWADAREAALSLQPARWIAATRPRWVALEQVPTVAPLWSAYALGLRALGYSAWCGVLNAADYGVPQTRRRAFLIASLDRPVVPPAPTHARQPGHRLFGAPAPWVSMAQALGWAGELDRRQRTRGVTARAVPASQPAPTLTAIAGAKGQWVVRTGTNRKVTGRSAADCQPYQRPLDRLAPVVDAKAGKWRLVPGKQALAGDRTRPRAVDQPAPTLAFGHDAAGWSWARPATTIAGDTRVFPPGGHIARDGRDNGRTVGRSRTEIRLSLAEALTLQSFRPNYPIAGAKGERYRQVGNAVPPRLAAHVLAAVTGRHLPTDAGEAGW